MQLSLTVVLSLPVLGLGAIVPSKHPRSTSSVPLFTNSDISIAEAPEEALLELSQNPNPDYFNSPVRARIASQRKAKRAETAYELVNTLFSGVYPTVNLTWGNTDG